MIFDILSDERYDGWTEYMATVEVRDVRVRYAAEVTDWEDVTDQEVIDGLADDWEAEMGGTYVTAEGGTVTRNEDGSVEVETQLSVTVEYSELDRYAEIL